VNEDRANAVGGTTRVVEQTISACLSGKAITKLMLGYNEEQGLFYTSIVLQTSHLRVADTTKDRESNVSAPSAILNLPILERP
jgi:hypothetical protein